ncbi:Lsr2 family protein [uncultured Pseudokineococcus sp.]|uniref:histone-like nucleoid-structuring protein Lsr2 n=1 Tax=uncultured Pseudokineococcus sp. TaxID=1642928 RepID=UPI00260946CB|nr:Lsr2 family protein [uncultured Pseudokineococcus sp.]
MAQKTQVTLVDDLDGSEATQTVTFAFQGTSYEIDLNDQHFSSIEESFAEWIESARKTTASRGAASSRANATRSGGTKRADLDDVRAWARDNGHTVADRGRVKQSILDAYDAAH